MTRLLKPGFIFFLVTVAMCCQGQKNNANRLTKKEKKQGWILLFDGVTTQGWTKVNGQQVPQTGWEVKDGTLKVIENAKGGDIVTTAEFSDFILSVDFLLTPTCNSGIKYFFTNYAKGGNLGMEYQVMDDVGASDNKQANHLCGSLYDILPADSSRKKMKALGKWNTAKIVSKGNLVEHWLNGKKVLSFERGSSLYLSAVEKSKYKTEPVFGMVEKGKILLQEHGHEVSFRSIKIRQL